SGESTSRRNGAISKNVSSAECAADSLIALAEATTLRRAMPGLRSTSKNEASREETSVGEAASGTHAIRFVSLPGEPDAKLSTLSKNAFTSTALTVAIHDSLSPTP